VAGGETGMMSALQSRFQFVTSSTFIAGRLAVQIDPLLAASAAHARRGHRSCPPGRPL